MDVSEKIHPPSAAVKPCRDAIGEIKRANREDGLDIVPITVKELLEHERVAT